MRHSAAEARSVSVVCCRASSIEGGGCSRSENIQMDEVQDGSRNLEVDRN